MRLALMKQPYPNRKEYECAFAALLPSDGIDVDPMAIGLAHTQEQLNVLAAIVHRVNCHDKLVEALDTLTSVIVLTPIAGNKEILEEAFNIARAALELAKGGTHD